MTTRPDAARSSARVAAVAVAALTAWSLVACGSSGSPSASTASTSTTPVPGTGGRQKPASKVPIEVQRTVAHLQAGEKPPASSGFSDARVPVRADGKLRLQLSAGGAVTDAQKAELTALGAEVIATGTAVGIIDTWVPFAKVEATAALPWVLSVTVPSPSSGR